MVSYKGEVWFSVRIHFWRLAVECGFDSGGGDGWMDTWWMI